MYLEVCRSAMEGLAGRLMSGNNLILHILCRKEQCFESCTHDGALCYRGIKTCHGGIQTRNVGSVGANGDMQAKLASYIHVLEGH